MDRMQIGVFHLEKEETFKNTYETAAWYESVKVQPGEFPVYASLDNSDYTPIMEPGSIKDTSVSCRLDGEVVGSDFSTLFCGNVVSPKIDEEVGKLSTHYIHPYAHSIAHALVDGKPTRFQLNDEFHARKSYYISDGKLKNSVGIYKKDLDLVWQVQQHFDDNHTILYVKKSKNSDLSVMLFHNGNYVVGLFNQDIQCFYKVNSFPVIDTEDTDYFINARKLYFEL